MHLSRRARLLAAVALVGIFGLSACGDDDEQPAASGEENTTTSAAEASSEGGETIEVTGVDYAFEGIPTTVEAGTEFTFRNGSDKEAHELVLVKVKEGETRSAQELLELPEEESEKLVEFQGVAVAPEPGGEGRVVDGELVVKDPGRYLALCFIQVGSDPAKLQEAMENPEGGPPAEDPDAGPPHFVQGMVQEFTVS